MSSPTPEFVNPSTLVRAGAGAGKTTRLVEEVIQVAQRYHQQHGHYPRMVLTTFTRKATQELKERLILQACRSEDQNLLEYLSSNSYLQISTIHGVLSLFLRRYGHLVGIDNGYKVISGQEAERESKKVVRDLAVSNQQTQELLSLFGVRKLSAILMTLSSHQLNFPEAHPVTEEELRGYWEKYVQTIAKPVYEALQLVKQSTSDPKFLEYAGIMEQVVADLFPAKQDVSRQIEVLQQRIPKQKPRFNKKNPQLPEEVNDQLGKSIADFKKELARPELHFSQWKQVKGIYQQLQKVSEQFHQVFHSKKTANGQFEMSDLESVTVQILRDHPELGQSFAADFDFWLIDEYQDTSPIQVELLNRLMGDSSRFIVGDPQQSIYLFRGARSEVFQERQQEFEQRKYPIEVKKKNYRSDPALLLFFNDFFSNYQSPFIAMDPRDSVVDSQKVVAQFCPVSQEDLAADPEAQLHAMGSKILQLLEQGAEPEHICVLGRTNAQLFEIAQYLRVLGFPTHLHVASGFYQRREIMDAMALLKFLVNPNDNKNLIMLLRSPWCRVADSDLAAFLFGKKSSYWEQIQQAEEFDQHEVIQQLKQWRQMRQQYGVSYCFEKALIEFGCIDFSHHHDVSGRRESNFWKLVCQLKEEERLPGFSYLKFIDRSFAQLDTEGGNDESDAVAALEPNHIQLMTIHSSKGLQFHHVLLPDMHKRPSITRTPMVSLDEELQSWSVSLPLGENLKSQGTVADLVLKSRRQKLENEENERVLYVALTRAKTSVFLSWEQPSHAHSWIASVPWNWTPGTHSTENYSYEVLQGPFIQPQFVTKETVQNQVRSLYESSAVSLRPVKASVTSLVEEQTSKANKYSSTSSVVPERVKKAVEGALMHRMMEILKTDWHFDFESVAFEWFGESAELFLYAADWVRQQTDIPFEEILQNGQVEWGYQRLSEGRIVEGQVDLWGVANNQVWIVDYKTGSQKYQDQAFQQLQLYSDAIKPFHPDKAIQLCVMYPMDQVVKVRPLNNDEL